MNLINATSMAAGYTMATDKTGRESIVVVVKGTYGIPDRPDQEPQLLAEQLQLVTCDEFTGEPGFSAPLYEIDFAPCKQRCDVLLNGSAYAPGGKPAQRVTVSLRVGSMTKSFDVVGNRTYQSTLGMTTVSDVEPFTVMPISYNNAYGGVDRTSEDPAKHRWYLSNHAGVGYYPTASAKELRGKPLPNTEETGRPVTSPNGAYRPMAFGPVGRSWQGRIKHAGTYDDRWKAEKFPFLPDDFDDRYFQCAPDDQQTDYLSGGEEVALTHLTRSQQTVFSLPRNVSMSALFFLRTGEVIEKHAAADTLFLEPDHKRWSLAWRTSQPVRRTIREVQQIVVGQTRSEWENQQRRQARSTGKRRFSSLREAIKATRPTSPA